LLAPSYFIHDTNIVGARSRLLTILQKLLEDYPGTIEEDLALLQDYRLDVAGDLLSPDMKVRAAPSQRWPFGDGCGDGAHVHAPVIQRVHCVGFFVPSA
jgi:hypothetical protein